MTFVATLVSSPNSRSVSADMAARAARECGSASIGWLADNVACDIEFSSGDPAAIQAVLREMIGNTPVDVVVQPAQGRRKALLVADMDSTMIDQECIDELADEVGIKEKVAAITARSMNGEIAFEPALRERVALLKNLREDVIDRLARDRLTLASGGAQLVSTMNRDGAWTALVSGGFEAFTSRIAAKLGFREHRANRLMVENGRLTGLVGEPILGREAKATALREMAARLGIGLDRTMAVGDGANDLDMLEIAGSGVALHAKPVVAAAAPMRIDHGDLTALLYIQGYRRDEFAA